jgi:hypothetical protein
MKQNMQVPPVTILKTLVASAPPTSNSAETPICLYVKSPMHSLNPRVYREFGFSEGSFAHSWRATKRPRVCTVCEKSYASSSSLIRKSSGISR